MRKRIIALVLVMCTLFLTGCAQGVHLSDEQNNIIAEYAADYLLKRSYVYMEKYNDIRKHYDVPTEEVVTKPVEEPTTEEPTTEKVTSGVNDPTNEPTKEEPTTENPKAKFDLVDVYKIAPLTVEYKQYRIVDEYPDDPDALFTFKPEDGYVFIIMEFDVYNPTDNQIVLNTANQNRVFKATINKGRCSNYANLLFNDISRIRDVAIEGQSHYQAVLVFMVESEAIKTIERFEVSVKDDEGNNRVLTIK